jgi:FkbM family methyltransferase
MVYMKDDTSLRRAILGALNRWRREARRRVLETVLFSTRSFHETIFNVLARRGHLIYCDRPAGKFFVDPSDRAVGGHLIWKGDFQLAELEQVVGLLRKHGRISADGLASKTFIDVGANIGTQTVYALNHGWFGRAISFEPEPRNFRLLKLNLAANQLDDRVAVFGAAVGATAGSAVLNLHPRNKGAHSIAIIPTHDSSETVEVEVVALKDTLAGMGLSASDVGLVWIDAEGAEPDVIEGMAELLGRVPLVLEYTPDRYDAERRRRLARRLKENYSAFYRIGSAAAVSEPIAALDSIATRTDILII